VVVGIRFSIGTVFMNLLTNARRAMANSPRKEIRISGSVGALWWTSLSRYWPRDSAGL